MKKLSRLSCFFTFLLVMILTCSCFAEKPENSVTPVSAINFDVSEANIAKGGKIKVIATVEPNEADSKKVIWSTEDASIAKVAADGTITGVAVGTTTITGEAAEGSGISNSLVVKVYQPIQSLKVASQTTVFVGKTIDPLAITVIPADADYQDVTWSSADETIATVDADGSITGVSEGTVKITATSTEPVGMSAKSKAVTCMVKVTKAVEGISLDAENIKIGKSMKSKITATVAPVDATNKKIKWSVDDSSVAAVSASGEITGKSVGTTKVYCEAQDGSGTKATVSVTVYQPVQSLKLDKKTVTVSAGKTSDALAITITPADAEYQTVTWMSSDESIAKVNEKGEITGIAGGTATITASSDEPIYGKNVSKSVSCKVSVTQAVEFVSLEKDEKKSTDSKLVLKLTVLPETATNKKMKWSSSDTKVATVKNGIVNIKKNEGTAVITAMAEDGSNIYASCDVNVGFSGSIFQIGNRVRRVGTYTWNVDNFTGNGIFNGKTVDEAMIPDLVVLTERDTDRDEILFRDIPWGTKYQSMKKDITFDSFWTPDYTDNGYGGYTYQTSFMIERLKVAGHQVDAIECFFVNEFDDEGNLKTGTSNAMLYEGVYSFDYSKSVDDDIYRKLVELYGQPDEKKSKSKIWYGKNNTMLTFTSDKSAITLDYVWEQGKANVPRAEALYQMMQKKKKNNELNDNKGNSEGL